MSVCVCCGKPAVHADRFNGNALAWCESCDGLVYEHRLGTALDLAQNMLAHAVASGRRTDCLREAVHMLDGALRNVMEE